MAAYVKLCWQEKKPFVESLHVRGLQIQPHTLTLIWCLSKVRLQRKSRP